MGKTRVEVRGGDFWIDGKPTYPGRYWEDHRVEGLLFNSRMVQATFDDLNPDTRGRWAYPDTGTWDPDRNTDEFVAMLPEYRRHGLLAVTVNFQGGSPEGYSRAQPWENSAFAADGSLRPAFRDRMRRVLEGLDAAGMVAIVGYFYQWQDERLTDEPAALRAVDGATDFLLGGGWRNVLVEVNNECDQNYEHPVLRPERVYELIGRVTARRRGGRRLLASTSYGRAGRVPSPGVVAASDYVLLHGNGTHDPALIADQVDRARALPTYRGQPVVFNEDDHFEFDRPSNNLLAALSRHASWGLFGPGAGAGGGGARGDYREGYQNVPVNWGINTERKRGFFDKVREITGA